MPYVVVKEEAQSHHRAMTFAHLQVCIGEGLHWICFDCKVDFLKSISGFQCGFVLVDLKQTIKKGYAVTL
jgi:hypothetical protein